MTTAIDESPAAIELVGVRRTFAIDDPDRPGAELDALAGVSVRIEAGGLVAVTGPSGSGKSTLLHVAGGLDRPSEGTVLVDGIDISALGPTALARVRNQTIGFVFQAFNLLPGLTVAENVALPAHLGRGREPDLDGRVADLLRTVGLTAKSHHRPSQLSGGEQQRVAVARALVLDPPIILADEPTGNLDSRAGAAVMDALLHAH
ncbi:MAG TPA: ABC transporter ATP-binding protein, partial [Acidimicrobiia bacterium]